MVINLRTDLRDLTDSELGTLLLRVLRRYEEAQGDAWPHQLLLSGQGLIGHPWFYPLTSIFAVGKPFQSIFGFAFSLTLMASLLGRSEYRALLAMHLALCEGRDISDEIDRRRARGSWSPQNG